MKKLLVMGLVAVCAPLASCAQGTPIDRAASLITYEGYIDRVSALSADSMRGRDTPSPELDQTAEWVAAEFQRFGLRGGMEDGSFIQRYPLEVSTPDPTASRLRASDGTTLTLGADFIPSGRGGAPDGEVKGGVVVISGSPDSSLALEPGALSGTHAVVVSGEGGPRALRPILSALRAARPASILMVTPLDDAGWAGLAARGMRPSVRRTSTGQAGPTVPTFQVRAASLDRLLGAHGISLEALAARADQELRVDRVGGLSATLTLRSHTRASSAPNVVAILDGSDPELQDQYVLFSAHMDHVGVGAPDASGDSIYNGADDNASGTAAVLEVARAMASLPVRPARSVLFLVVSGEEKGLWGSAWFADHPTVPLDQVVADLNIDMVARSWPDTIVAIGKEYSELGATFDRVSAAHPELHITAIGDRWPEQNYFRRSDHFNFARKGVPSLALWDGNQEDYHQPSDEVENFEGDKGYRLAKLVFYVAVGIANQSRPPQWDPERYREVVTTSGG